MTMQLLSCDKVSKLYRSGITRRKKKQALQNVSFHVNEDEVFGIIGLNGAGKSTILKILMGFISHDSGSTKVAGQRTGSVNSHHHLGFLPEHPSLYPDLSINEHLRFACRVGRLNNHESTAAIEKVLDTVKLIDVAQIPIKNFSKGMAQRAALAYALVLEPKILILDEPMSGLDPLGRQMVIDIIKEYQYRKTTILFCSHILTDVERVCDRIGILNQGKLIAITTPKDLSTRLIESNLKNGKTPLETYFLDVIKGEQ